MLDNLTGKGKQELTYIIERFNQALDREALLILIDSEDKIQYVSESFYRVTGLHKHQVLNSHYHLFEEGYVPSRSLTERKEMLIRNENGAIHPYSGTILSIFENSPPSKRYALFVLQKEPLNEKDDQVKKKEVLIDEFTLMPNHQALKKVISKKIVNGSSFTLIFFEIERFKSYLEDLGPFSSEDLLIEVGVRLKSLQTNDVSVYRYGIDEFCLVSDERVVPDTPRSLITKLTDLFNREVTIGKQVIKLSVNIGITQCVDPAISFENVLDQARSAMRCSKETVECNFTWYDSTACSLYEKKLLIEKRLRTALIENQFHLVYQPQIDLRQKRVVGVEALIRWQDRVLGVVPPSEFIPIAEETGLIIDIGEWVIEESCLQANKWKEEGLTLRMSVNISPVQFQHREFLDNVKATLSTTQMDPAFLNIEITENQLLYHLSKGHLILEKLKKQGVQISIDDFGTGYCTYSYLKKFPIDTLKIDQSFIQDLSIHANDEAIVTSIIDLARNLNINVIAEGVESREVMSFLDDSNCNEMQGYFYCKPLMADDVKQFLHDKKAETMLGIS